MNKITILKISCYICVAGGLASKLLINNSLLGSMLAIGFMALAIILLGIALRQNKRN